MNREERRRLNKVNKKEQNEFLIKNVRSIYDVLNDTEELIEKVSKNIVKVDVPKNISKICEKTVTVLENFKDLFDGLRVIFLHDEKCKNGFVKKCVTNALEVPMYKANLDEFVTNVRKNKKKDMDATMEYLICHDLSVNKIEVKRTLDMLEKSLPAVIANLKVNNVENIEYISVHLLTLERRLYRLYCLYGQYLKDIGNIMEYRLIYQLFNNFDITLINLMNITSNEV